MNEDGITKNVISIINKNRELAWASHKFHQMTDSLPWKDNRAPNHNIHCFSKIE